MAAFFDKGMMAYVGCARAIADPSGWRIYVCFDWRVFAERECQCGVFINGSAGERKRDKGNESACTRPGLSICFVNVVCILYSFKVEYF